MSSSSDSDDNDYDDWTEEPTPTRSLFDSQTSASALEAIESDSGRHGFHLLDFSASLGLDFYNYLRLVNFVRAEKPSVQSLKELKREATVFEDEKWLKPVLEDDGLLQIDYDELIAARSKGKSVATADSDRIRDLEDQLASLHLALDTLRSQSRDTLDDAGPSTMMKKRDDDTHYFRSYGTNEIHESMLKDAIRTDAYRDFILNNPQLFAGKVVLDVGCGTGILSMFAARAGARKVYAVDASQIAHAARRNIAENGLEGVIEVLQGKVEDVELPERVDVCISEWMGYFLLYESMLDSVLHARDRFLSPGGLMAPSQCSILLAGADDPNFVRERIDYWQDVYGFKMTAMQAELYDDAIIDTISPDSLLTSLVSIKDIHVTSTQVADVDFTSSFSLVPARTGALRMLCAHFDTFFTHDGRSISALSPSLATGEITFTTSSAGTKTHWAQTLFLLGKPLEVKEGEPVKGTIKVRKAPDNTRELVVEVVFDGGEAQVWNVR